MLKEKPPHSSLFSLVIRLMKGLLAQTQRDRLTAYEALKLPIFAKEKTMKIGLIKVSEDNYSESDEYIWIKQKQLQSPEAFVV